MTNHNLKQLLAKFIIENTSYRPDEILGLTMPEMNKIVIENGLEEKYKLFRQSLNNPVYFVEVTRNGKQSVLEVQGESKVAVLHMVQDAGYIVDKLVLKHGHHYCKNCGLIATGTSVDVLCPHCKGKYNVNTYKELKNVK